MRSVMMGFTAMVRKYVIWRPVVVRVVPPVPLMGYSAMALKVVMRKLMHVSVLAIPAERTNSVSKKMIPVSLQVGLRCQSPVVDCLFSAG